MTKRKTGNPRVGSLFDDFMKEEGFFEEANTQAIKEVIAWQLAEEMKEKGITKVRMARDDENQPQQQFSRRVCQIKSWLGQLIPSIKFKWRD